MINEVNFISVGNAKDVKFWSGVPYYLSCALIDLGIKVNYINIEKLPITSKIITKIIRMLKKDSIVTFRTGKIYSKLMSKEMKIQIRKYPQADLNIII